MPKNLGLYNDNLSVPRKQDVDAVQEQVNNLSDSIGGFVVAQDPVGVVDTVPPTFGGYTVDAFTLKSEIVDNTSSTAIDVPLSANQGNILKQAIQQNNTNISNINGQIQTINNNIENINSDVTSLTSSVNGKLNITGGALTGQLVAQSNTNYSIGQVRNIYLSTNEPDNSLGNNGDIWIVYEV